MAGPWVGLGVPAARFGFWGHSFAAPIQSVGPDDGNTLGIFILKERVKAVFSLSRPWHMGAFCALYRAEFVLFLIIVSRNKLQLLAQLWLP